MSQEYCKACAACNERNYAHCDNCTAYRCQENMKMHMEIFSLNDNFYRNVNDAENELIKKAKEIEDKLSKDYNIYISHCNCSDHYECFLDGVKNKYNEMQNLEYSLNNQMYQNKTNFEKEKRNISYQFEIKLKELNNSCELKKREITDTKGKRNKDIEKYLTKKEKTKKKLEDKKEKIKSTNINEIVNDYINREKPQMENEYQNEKNIIDDKNKTATVNLEYTEEEKNLENYYLNTICNIKNYSKKIPFFDDWMKAYNLNNYLN